MLRSMLTTAHFYPLYYLLLASTRPQRLLGGYYSGRLAHLASIAVSFLASPNERQPPIQARPSLKPQPSTIDEIFG